MKKKKAGRIKSKHPAGAYKKPKLLAHGKLSMIMSTSDGGGMGGGSC